jgi:hypothetical protein
MGKKLVSLIMAPLLAGALVSEIGCDFDSYKSAREVLKENKGIDAVEIKKGDTYWEYAKELKRKYPEKLRDLDIRDVCIAIKKDYNNGKKLREGEKVNLPTY